MSLHSENIDVGNAAMAEMGVGQITYIRPSMGGDGFTIFAADGSKLAEFPSYDAAYFTARQFNLVPVSVH